uniref:Uncharacterized protein n=1 Tax=Arundo donax TaxID=35708 RepID=A0A0A9HAU2_ARUDO
MSTTNENIFQISCSLMDLLLFIQWLLLGSGFWTSTRALQRTSPISWIPISHPILVFEYL